MLADSPDGPPAWERAHPAIRQQLYAAETALAAAVDRHARERSTPATGMPQRFDRHAARQQLAWLRSERDQLQAQLRSYPHQLARAAQLADQQAAQADRDAHTADQRARHAQREYEEMGWLARHSQPGSTTQARADTFQEQAQHHQQHADLQRQAADQARAQPGGPADWDRQHPGVRDRLAIYEHALEHATLHHAQQAIAIRAQRDPITRVLGPRPQHPDRRTIWNQAEEAISAYRLAHNITSHTSLLGPEPDRGSTRGREQHADWEHATQLTLHARQQLGIDARQRPGPIAEQARHIPHLTPPGPDHGRGLGR